MKIAFIGNQGGEQVYGFYSAMAKTLKEEFKNIESVFSVWLDSEKANLVGMGWVTESIYSFEKWVSNYEEKEAEISRLASQYHDIDWSEVIAAERSFTDYSQLLGSAGERIESAAYIYKLLINIVTYLEFIYNRENIKAIVCQTSDTLFSLVAIKLGRHLGISIYAITPGWLLEQGTGGGFFTNTEFLECNRMIDRYKAYSDYKLSVAENRRVDNLIDSIIRFKDKSEFHVKVMGASAGKTAVSPNVSRIYSYLKENSKKIKDVEYMKIDPVRKFLGNIKRVYRKFLSRKYLGLNDISVIPRKSVFFAIHYQPEQSTLAQGIYSVNQVALIENISKSLPLGYTLVVKEHPWGRGSRPVWQYKHINRLYNVIFCDAPAKEIICKVDAVIGVTGTVAVESLVMDKPTIILGKSFFTHYDLLYKVSDIHNLANILRRILIDREYDAIEGRDINLRRFLLSYLYSLIPYFPTIDNASYYAMALAKELNVSAIYNDRSDTSK